MDNRVPLDPRIHPYRADLAASYLKGKVEARRFVDGTTYQVIEPTVGVRREPSHTARLDTEALFGEKVIVYEMSDEGWAWGQLEHDRYVGWLSANALGLPGAPPTHEVTALRTLAFPAPDIKVPPLAGLPLGAQVAIVRQDERFALTASGWHLPVVHLSPLGTARPDFVATAERFLGSPYLWGGKTSLGLDCSALVQIAMHAAGHDCPRDSDMQEQRLGSRLAFDDLRRGDLIFWKGHVAIARDGNTLIHANAHHMAVIIEPITDALARIKAAGSEPTSVRRLV